jgi:cell division protein FtsL
MIKRRQQRGLTLIGLVLWGIILVFIALLAMKLIPAYTEYFTIQKILRDIGNDPNLKSMSNGEIRDKFSKRAMVDNINTIKATDLEIGRDGGQTVVSAEYQFQTPLVGNVSLLVDFSASSDGGGASN